MSCAVLVLAGPHRVLLTGDIGIANEAAIIARWPGWPRTAMAHAADGRTRHSAWRTGGVRYWHNRPGPRMETDLDIVDEPAGSVPIEPFIAG